jgi:hypothetical protein
VTGEEGPDLSDDGTTTPGYETAAPGPVSERMQALLARAVEDQLSEQRTVAGALAGVRAQVAAVGEGLRAAASGAAVERLRTDLAALTGELRSATSGLGERFDTLSRRLDEQGEALSAGDELGIRLAAVAADVAAGAAAVHRLTAAVTALAAFPDALAALQGDVAGMHDRLVPLAEIRTGLGDLQSRATAAERLGPELAALTERVDALATTADVSGLHDAVTGLGERLDALTGRPALTAADLTDALAPVHERLTELAAEDAGAERMTALQGRLEGLDASLGDLRGELAGVRDAVAGVPALAADLSGVADQVAELGRLRGDVQGLQERLTVLQEGSPEVVDALAGLRGEVAGLAADVAAFTVPTPEEIAAAVTTSVTGQLVDELAPRVAEIVLARIGATVTEQVAGQVAERLAGGVTTPVLEGVRASAAATERRLRSHTDEAILALAEALLRRRRALRPEPVETQEAAPPPATAEAELPEPGAEPVPSPSGQVQTVPEPVVVPDDAGADDGSAPVDEQAGEPEPESELEPDVARPAQGAGSGERGTPVGPPQQEHHAHDDDHARRRPWWRPGG